SQIPLLTINLLQALPKTPLWDRLEREGRLIHDDGRDSNVDFLLPYDQVVAMWKDCMARAYEPEAVLARYDYQIRNTFVNRLKLPATPQRASKANIKRGLIMLRNIIWQIGFRSDYKLAFWRFALPLLARGDIEGLLTSMVVAHHLIVYAREASSGQAVASNYSLRLQQASVPAE
ncbi:DUF4070 domain-containing protein, partial [Rhodopseudomonas sp. B29]|uniref:DUF4070 domain-containing protein n=1 Tax=Rhodopseudomonas sp. B29 TaxID=95607 RepID=UPI0003B65160